jgi:hypothetical protein
MYDPETGVYELEADKPLILLLGSVSHEGVLSKLQASNRQYKSKFLESKVKNWESILKYFDDYVIDAVLIKLTPHVITLMASNEYKDVRVKLFKKIGEVSNILFVYEDLLSGEFETHSWLDQPSEEDRNLIFEMLSEHGINVLPYKRNSEVTVMAETFLTETEQNLIFRLYVPTGRLWSNESDKLIQLFRDYLAKVASIKVRLDQYRTDKGVIYEIHSEEVESSAGIDAEFSEFTQFMDLCVTDPSAAENMLKEKSVKPKDLMGLLSRYSKEAKRLNVDLKHEREQKILSIKHRLESELVDTIPGATDWSSIDAMVNMAVPALSGSKVAIAVDQEPTMLSGSSSHGNITVNVNSQIIDTVNGVIAQEIRGDQTIGVEAQQLLGLINKYGGVASQDLASSVHELEDKSAPKSGRLNAKQKLKKFLIEVSKKTGDVAMGVLQSYIEKQLGL